MFANRRSSIKLHRLSLYHVAKYGSPPHIALGFSAAHGITVIQELVYNPSTLPVGQMFMQATFPSIAFSTLVKMDVEVIAAVLGTMLVIPGFDNNVYTAYIKQ